MASVDLATQIGKTQTRLFGKCEPFSSGRAIYRGESHESKLEGVLQSAVSSRMCFFSLSSSLLPPDMMWNNAPECPLEISTKNDIRLLCTLPKAVFAFSVIYGLSNPLITHLRVQNINLTVRSTVWSVIQQWEQWDQRVFYVSIIAVQWLNSNHGLSCCNPSYLWIPGTDFPRTRPLF